ncbi:MAG TPA: acyl-CoA dehydrogenase [Casimicrobiaceae bacterium]|jgi:alkylation response protein AidB-like acyl-CoA dehydrogenase|nr:acyl-CoA dehydrogenase [Casimicrobiaceae bacterium]
MSTYHAPLPEMTFVMNELAGLSQVASLPGFEDATPDTVAAILAEAAKFATDVLDPLNQSGDREGAVRLPDGSVRTPKGFKDAYLRFVANGWNGLTKNPEYGGQGLPQLVSTPIEEMWHSANMAFDLCPLLTQGAIEAIELAGSDYLKATFLPKMVSGEWTGTMNLTEAQAGSDLAAVRTRAEPQDDGTYKLFGQKIFITYGEHDYTDNIVHLVLARLPDAPPGVKGISLFVVPKWLVNADGSLGERNDVLCVSIEHKLGIHASPTAVLAYGDHGGATGWLVGEANRGLEYMFIMMNLARFSVGMEGVGIGERAYQRAVAFARERVQGRPVGTAPAAAMPAIIEHPDVRRMLMTMRASTEAMRAVAYVTAAALDNARRNPDAGARAAHLAFAEFMVPIVKGWSTETAQRVANLGLQVHGGMGFIEETGAAQHVRDARIITIYEGTTAIQANDFVGRKTARDQGAVASRVLDEVGKTALALKAHGNAALVAMGERLEAAAESAKSALAWLLRSYASNPRDAFAGSVPYLELWGHLCGGWQMGRAALVAEAKLTAGDGDPDFWRVKLLTSGYYAEAMLPRVEALAEEAMHGGENALALAAAQF